VLQILHRLLVGALIENWLEYVDYFRGMCIFFLKLLVMATALECVSSLNEVSHFLIELVASTLLF
jgi:hypothetical protein